MIESCGARHFAAFIMTCIASITTSAFFAVPLVRWSTGFSDTPMRGWAGPVRTPRSQYILCGRRRRSPLFSFTLSAGKKRPDDRRLSEDFTAGNQHLSTAFICKTTELGTCLYSSSLYDEALWTYTRHRDEASSVYIERKCSALRRHFFLLNSLKWWTNSCLRKRNLSQSCL